MPPRRRAESRRTAERRTRAARLGGNGSRLGRSRDAAGGTLCLVFRDGWGQFGALVRADSPGATRNWRCSTTLRRSTAIWRCTAAWRARRAAGAGGACGSGRCWCRWWRRAPVVGVDISPHMLALSRAKLAASRDGLGTARLEQADMRPFDVPERDFDLAIVAVKSFAYLTERDDQLRCLRTIAAHLRPGGCSPSTSCTRGRSGSARRRAACATTCCSASPERGFTLSRVESVVSTDLAARSG